MAVWDVFTYFDEEDVLEIRLDELSAVPDIVHIAIESRRTLSGLPKPLYLDGSEERFARYRWSLRRWESPPYFEEDAAENERLQRNAGRLPLAILSTAPDDIVLFGDVDEIPTAYAAQAAAEAARGGGIVATRMPYHSLLANLRLPLDRDRWNHRWPIVGTLGAIDALGGLSAARERSEGVPAFEGGWHLSSMGGPDPALRKCAAFVHHDEPWRIGLDADRLRDLAIRRRDIADRFTQDRVPSAELPRLLRTRPENFRHLLDASSW